MVANREVYAGYGAAAETWFAQRDALLGAGYQVILLDRRSHGWSDCPAYGHRLSRHAKDLQEFLEYLDLEKVFLAGQSMGASTIYAYLSLFGDAKLMGAVSIDQTPQMINTEAWEYGMYNLNKEVLPRVSVPFLFIAGRQSPFWPCGHARASAELCPAGEYEIIDECGHAVNWEQVDKCNDTILRFLAKVTGKRI